VISIGDDEDDLTTIHGIGPAYAAVLGELGIHSYRQLASIDSGTLAELRSRLGPLARRIERDRWIESAAAAYRAKRNESRRDAVVR
jgi:predicted flap endonuclease-1-like 5' DNA nuclease